MKKSKPNTSATFSAKFLAILLAMALALTLLAGCNGNGANGGDGEKPKTNTPGASTGSAFENVYSERDLQIDLASAGMQNFSIAGDRIYYDTHTPYSFGAMDYVDHPTIVSVDSDGGDMRTEWEMPEAGEGETAAFLSGFAADDAGNLWITLMVADPENDGSFRTALNRYPATGGASSSVDLTELDPTLYAQGSCVDAAGNFYISSGQAIYAFDAASGQHAFTLREEGYLTGPTRGPDGSALYLVTGRQGGGYLVKTINFASKSADAGKSYDAGNKMISSLAPGMDKYGFTFVSTQYVYGVDLATMTDEVIVSFINSDIDTSGINGVIPLTNGEFIMRKQSGYSATGFSKLTENTSASAGEKAVITFGVMFLDNDTKAEVLEFNKSSSKARIEIVDYSTYNTSAWDTAAGIAQLDMDILGGRAPDIISLSALQPSKYVSKGVLEDLTPYLESDQYVSREDLFENILDATSTDGKLYHITPFFTIQTVVGKSSIFGERTSITTTELENVVNRYPDAMIMYTMSGFSFGATTSSEWLSNAANAIVDAYIDWETLECSFNSQEFIDFLEFTKRFPATAPSFDPDFDFAGMYTDDKVLLSSQNIASVRDVRTYNETFGEQVAMFGYPTADESGSAIIMNADFAISKNSQHKELAWEFISRLLREDITLGASGGGGFGFGGGAVLSINKNRFEDSAEQEMLPIEQRDFAKGVTVYGTTYTSLEQLEQTMESWRNMGDMWSGFVTALDTYPLSEDEVSRVREAIEGAEKIYGANTQIMSIIQEEAGAFLSGAKSAADAANIIQSRVSIFISETN
ncbi:MAG: extracellular solute-binding protein, partial [Oscillospiraceae bacterium]|jgi:ABC-type glycerol-3-phosphate transport system substrate-binding protein|nr:extracellular solute-binding protein [Oscillospiraceae bacterium]